MALFDIALDLGSDFILCEYYAIKNHFFDQELNYLEFYLPVLDQKNSVEWCNEPSLLQERTIITLSCPTQWSLPSFYSYRSNSARASNLFRTLPIFTQNLDNPRGCSASRGPRTRDDHQMLK